MNEGETSLVFMSKKPAATMKLSKRLTESWLAAFGLPASREISYVKVIVPGPKGFAVSLTKACETSVPLSVVDWNGWVTEPSSIEPGAGGLFGWAGNWEPPGSRG